MDFLTQLRARLNERITERQAAKASLDAILKAPTDEARDLNATEAAAFAEARAKITDADDAIKDLEARIADLETIEARERTVTAAMPENVGGAKVKAEARTYTRETERRDGVNFLRDLAAGQRFGDPEANQRLARHMAEERVERPGIESRAVGTSAFAGLVVPQYLVDMVAPTRRAGRPLADIANKHPLPADGMTVNISKITTASTAAIQTQNSGASETNMDDTLLSVDVLTAAGQQTASLQALQRGTGIETVILGDLLGAVNTLVDSTIINQATTGLDAVTDANLDIAYTDASPTAAELWPKLFDAVQQVQTSYFSGPSHLVMHPRRFWWLASNVGTSFPFVNLIGAGAQSGGSVTTTGYGSGIAGYLAGLPVVLDANIVTNGGGGTNEDRIYAVAADEVHLWEDEPVFIRAEQTNAASLGVLFVAYKYFAYTVSRYVNANARIAGTGLATPSF